MIRVNHHDIIVPRGMLRIEIWQKGKQIARYENRNLVVNSGRNLIRDLLARTPGASGLNYFALGTGTAAPVVTDTQLGAEVFRDTLTKLLYDTGKLTVQYYLATTAANGYALSEAGLFGGVATGAANSGTLYSRVLLDPVINKNDSISITFSWDLTWEAI